MTEDSREPQEQEFRGWHLGPFFAGRSYEVTPEMRRRRSHRNRWCAGIAFVLIAVNQPVILGLLISLAVAGIVLAALIHYGRTR